MGTVREHRRANMLLLIERLPGVDKDKTQKAFAEKAGIPPAYVSQIAQEFREMGDKVARRIEKNFGLERGQMDSPNLGEFEIGPQVTQPRGAPIVGRAMLGEDGYFVEEEYPPGHGDGIVPHHSRDQNAYALRVVGESMAPAIKSGWLVVIEPNSQPVVGEYVHVLTKKGQHMIKQLLSMKRDTVSLTSVNGGAIITFKHDELEYVQCVGGIYPPSKRQL